VPDVLYLQPSQQAPEVQSHIFALTVDPERNKNPIDKSKTGQMIKNFFSALKNIFLKLTNV